MTYFIENLKTYIINQGLIATSQGLELEFYDENNANELLCLFVYDTDAELGRLSIQILARFTNPKTCLDKLYPIYNHFFDNINFKLVSKTINNKTCKFKAVSKPAFIKKSNDMFNYAFNFEVYTQDA